MSVSLSDLASWATIFALIVSLAALAISAWKYVQIRSAELRKERFATYHQLVRAISSGSDSQGLLKIQSQLAFIYELRNFPEYADLSESVLNLLRSEWSDDPDATRKDKLHKGIDETLARIQKAK